MPVPRRFDRRPPERDTTRINDRIRVPEVRLVGEDGKQIGVIKTAEALAYAQERDLDLVEVAPDARPPVCRVLDYSKYKYEQAQKQKAARKHQQQINIREIKFRPKIAQNDYDTKKGHVRRFLKGKDKVKVTIMFRGREVTHPERGVALLDKLAEELADVGTVEQSPLQDGRNMTMMLGALQGRARRRTGRGVRLGRGHRRGVTRRRRIRRGGTPAERGRDRPRRRRRPARRRTGCGERTLPSDARPDSTSARRRASDAAAERRVHRRLTRRCHKSRAGRQ